MLSQAQKNQIIQMADRDLGNNCSMAASLHKLVEERDGFEKAVEAVEFYCQTQRSMVEVLNLQADQHEYMMLAQA